MEVKLSNDSLLGNARANGADSQWYMVLSKRVQ